MKTSTAASLGSCHRALKSDHLLAAEGWPVRGTELVAHLTLFCQHAGGLLAAKVSPLLHSVALSSRMNDLGTVEEAVEEVPRRRCPPRPVASPGQRDLTSTLDALSALCWRISAIAFL